MKRLDSLKAIRAAKLRARDLEAYKQARMAEGAAPATINRELEILRRALKLGVDNELVARIPPLRFLALDNARTGVLDQSDSRKLRDSLPEPVRLIFILG